MCPGAFCYWNMLFLRHGTWWVTEHLQELVSIKGRDFKAIAVELASKSGVLYCPPLLSLPPSSASRKRRAGAWDVDVHVPSQRAT
jgi:hypothetical protein